MQPEWAILYDSMMLALMRIHYILFHITKAVFSWENLGEKLL
jgi:hypothetical protein